jgi:acyl CoA:acetate/3-ketoacid CoA transferase alpha subunit
VTAVAAPSSPISSAYTDALREARAAGYHLGAEGIARLRRMFGVAVQDLTRQLATVGDDQVTKERATVLREQIEQTLALIERRIAELTQETAQKTAEAVVEIHREVNLDLARTYRNDLVPDFTKAFDVVQVRAVTTFAARSQNAATYKTLARRNVRDAAPALDNLLGSAIARGVSSGRLTQDVAALLVGGTPDLTTYGLDPADVSGLKTLLYDARRIAVTETNNALREGNRMALMASPIVKAVKWTVSGRHEAIPGLAPDECDTLAEGNDAEDLAELGELPPGYYSPKRFPLAPHPFCACVQGGPTIFYRPSEWGRLLGKHPPEPEPVDELADDNLVAILKEKVREELPDFTPASPNKIATLTARELQLDRARVVRLLERARREVAIEDRIAIIARAKELLAEQTGTPRVETLVREFGILQEDAARLLTEAEHELKLAQVTDQQLFEAALARLKENGGLKGDAVVYLIETFKVTGQRAITAVDRALSVLAGVTDEQLVEVAIAELGIGKQAHEVAQHLVARFKVPDERAFAAVNEAIRRLGRLVDYSAVDRIVREMIDAGPTSFLLVLNEVQRRVSKWVDVERVRIIFEDRLREASKAKTFGSPELRQEIEDDLREGKTATSIIRILNLRFDEVPAEEVEKLVRDVQANLAAKITDAEVKTLARKLLAAHGGRELVVAQYLADSVLAGDNARALRIVRELREESTAAQAAELAGGRAQASAAREKLATIKAEHEAEADRLAAERTALLQEITRLDLAIAEAQRAAKSTGAAGIDLNLLPEVQAAGVEVDAALARMKAIEEAQKTVAARKLEAAYQTVEVKQDPKRAGTIAFISKVDAKRRAVWQKGIDVIRRLVPPEVLDGFKTDIAAFRGQRSRYASGIGAQMSKDATFEIVAHELGHALEYYRPEILSKSIAWREGRTVGERAVTMRSLFPRHGYKPSEVTKVDKFFHPYVGKTEYVLSASEVLSMGLEEMARDPIAFAEKDPDMFDFIFSVLRSAMNANPPKRGRIA